MKSPGSHASISSQASGADTRASGRGLTEYALAGLERWKARHPEAASQLEPADVLVDAMRGRFHTWTRVRVNLQHVPVEMRPDQEPLDPDREPDDWAGISPDAVPRRTRARARKES